VNLFSWQTFSRLRAPHFCFCGSKAADSFGWLFLVS